MSVRDEVREAQSAQYDDPEMKAATVAIYDKVDALTESQKSLLIRDALSLAHATVAQSVQHPEAGGAGLAMLAAGLIALAGYTNETQREDRGETSTGDRRVTDVLDSFRDLVKTTLTAGMDPVKVALMKKVAERVNERVEQGESFESVVADEYAKFQAEHGDLEAPAAAAKTPDKETPETYGLYL